jgi:hypothetical protein
MLKRTVHIAAFLALLSGLLSMVAVSEPPSDVSSTLWDSMQSVVNRLSIGLSTGSFPFSATPIEMGPGVRTFMTAQQFTPPKALQAIEKGFPTERFETDEEYIVWDRTIPAGRYYLILWLADRQFERFGIKFPARIPLLLFVREQNLELMEFGIACYLNVPVPNPAPQQILPLTMFNATPDCQPMTQQSATASKLDPESNQPRVLTSDIDHWGMTSWGLGGVVVTVAEAKLKNACVCEFPTQELLFPQEKGEDEEDENCPCDPPPPPS